MKLPWPCALAIFLLIIPAVEAQNCGELGKDVRGVQSAAFDEYPALNDVKQSVLLLLYGRGSANCPEELYNYALTGRDFVLKFDEAYNLSRSNSSSDRTRAMVLSEALKETAKTGLKDTGLGASAQDIATSAETAVLDFLVTQAKVNEREGEATNETRKKIEHYRLATTAYETADEGLLATNTRIVWKQLESEYLQDMQKADERYSLGDEKFGYARSLAMDIPSRITAYAVSKEALELFQDALVLYRYHVETEKIAATEEKVREIDALMSSLRVTIGIYFIVLASFLIAVSLFLLHRILAWKADSYEHYLGNELIRVKGIGR